MADVSPKWPSSAEIGTLILTKLPYDLIQRSTGQNNLRTKSGTKYAFHQRAENGPGPNSGSKLDGLSIDCGQFWLEEDGLSWTGPDKQNFENLGPDGTIRTGPDQDQEKIENPGPNGPWIPDGHMTHI